MIRFLSAAFAMRSGIVVMTRMKLSSASQLSRSPEPAVAKRNTSARQMTSTPNLTVSTSGNSVMDILIVRMGKTKVSGVRLSCVRDTSVLTSPGVSSGTRFVTRSKIACGVMTKRTALSCHPRT